MDLRKAPHESFARRLARRSRRYLLPLALLEIGVAYFFSWHLALRRSLDESTERLGGLSSLDSGAAALAAAAETDLVRAVIVLVLAIGCSAATIACLTLLGWSARCLRRHIRFAADAPARIEIAGAAQPSRLVDLSCTGCRLSLPSQVEPGAEAVLTVADALQLPAKVVWSKSGAAGLRFLAPLDPEAVRAISRSGGGPT